MKILIVEDEVIPAHYLKRLLELEGYDVLETVETGKEAISVAKKEAPNLILMDIMLEDNISGCDAAVEINYHNPNINIIFLTAYSDKEMIDVAVESNAYGYLLKPYRDKEILATIALLKAKTEKKERAIYPDPSIITLNGSYSYCRKTKNLRYRAEKVFLGPQAIKLIHLLCENPHHTLDINNILSTLWNNKKSKQALRSLVYRIRKATISELIVNANKTGYQIGLDT